nr:hypothetical protein [Pseudopedobacter sp.]
MKLKKHNYLLLFIAVLAFTACKQKSGNTAPGISPEDSMKIAFYDKYFLPGQALSPNSINTSVNAKLAQDCLDLFGKVKKNRIKNELDQMFKTESVSFKFSELSSWMNDSLKNVTFDSIRVCIGVYDKGLISAGNKPQSHIGRLTVFLWPYYQGKKALKPKVQGMTQDAVVEPFNFGDLHP